MHSDEYRCLSAPAEGIYTEKKSKFLAFAHYAETVDEAKTIVAEYQKKYYDARHVCYAYRIGTSPTPETRANDNGEPSGTAGKPILGQILSHELTNTLVVVVRYFGGIKLGTGGLTTAYKAAAAEALSSATIEVRLATASLHITFEYPLLNSVMRVVKDLSPTILSQTFDLTCRMTLAIRTTHQTTLHHRLSNIEGVTVESDE